MDNDSEAVRIFSPGTGRVLWVIAIAVVGLSLAFSLWSWARRGEGWTTNIGPLGTFLLVAGFAAVRSRGRLAAVLQVVGLVLITADMIMTLRRW